MSTKRLTAFVFDDQPTDLREVEDALSIHWHTLQESTFTTLPDLEILTEDDHTKVTSRVRAVRNSGKQIDMFFFDVLVETKGPIQTQRGFLLAKEAKRAFPNSIVVTISNGSHPFSAGFLKEIQDSQNPHIWKSDLLGSIGHVHLEKIASLYQESTAPSPRISIVEDSDVQGDPLKYRLLLEVVGESTLERFGSHFSLGSFSVMHLTCIKAGLSGAYIFRVSYTDSEGTRSNRQLLLKVSRDLNELANEKRNFQTYIHERRLFSQRLCTQFSAAENPYTHLEWGALGMDFLNGSKTLHEWLSNTKLEARATDALLADLMLGDGMGHTFKESRASDSLLLTEVVQSDLLPPKRKDSILTAIKELTPLLKLFDPAGNYEDHQLATRFLLSSRIGNLDKEMFSKQKIVRTFSHRDFHSRNVMIEPGSAYLRPKIVDYANLGSSIWGTDVARLLVDLFVSGMRWELRDHGWALFAEWMSVAESIISGTKLEPTVTLSEADQNFYTAILWLRGNVFEIYQLEQNDQKLAEFQLVLASEFLRTTYRSLDVSTPKRAFALVAGCHSLRCAEKLLQKTRLLT